MGIGRNEAVRRQLRTLFNVGAVRELTDGQLLERFATDRGEAAELAFAVLVERHGPMVLRVCRGVLGDDHAAQDAFQATFLVLVRRARGLWVRDSIGPWLHQVAYRTATCARATAARHRRLDRRAAVRLEEARADRDFELEELLHEEVDRLPERFRSPVVLCDLEGRTYEQAARHLGWPVGTVKSRLSRGRDRLRDRLIRRGVASEAGPLVVAGALKVPAVTIPPALLDATTAAARFAAVGAPVGGPTVALAEGALRTMTMSQWWKVATALVVAVATASGVEWIGVGTGAGAQAPAEKRDREPRVAEAPTVEVRPGKVRLALKERGNVEAARNDDVYCNVEGGTTIIKLVPEGQVVKKGDTICELDSAALKDRLINQRITVKSAEANFLNARLTREVAELAVREARDVLRQDDEALKRAIDGGRAAIEKLEGRLKRNREASQRFRSAAGSAVHYEKTPADLIAEVDIQDRIEDVELRLEAERRSLTQAEGKREILRDSTVPKTIKALEVAVTKAHADELARQATWELEKSKEAKLERQIANCTLTAPRDGCVIYANDPSRMFGGGKQIEEGATVRERQKVVSIVNFNDPMRINAKVPEDVIAQVVPKMKARITIDAFPGLSFVGLVDEIAPLPDPYAFATWDRKVYSTRIRIGGGHPGLRPGMTATAEILLDERDDAIAVPVKAVARYDGKDHVAVKAPGGRVEWRDVVLGPSDGTIVEVKEGLRGGDHVFAEAEPLLGDEQRARRDAVVDPLGEKDAVPKKARGGARPRLFIVVADRAGVIRVPVKAVSHYDAKDHVVVIRPPTTEPRPGGAIEWRVVALGASDGTTVEVKGGLKSGERILLREAGLEKFRGGGRAGR